jgi:hypothetical protein
MYFYLIIVIVECIICIYALSMSIIIGIDSEFLLTELKQTKQQCINSITDSRHYPTSTRRHGNFAGVHTLLRILLSSNSAVLINIITGVLPPHIIIDTFYHRIEEIYPSLCFITIFFVVLISIQIIIVWRGMCYFLACVIRY